MNAEGKLKKEYVANRARFISVRPGAGAAIRLPATRKPGPAPLPSIEKTILPLADWLERDLPPSDPLLGHWLTTTSRVLFPAPTGSGNEVAPQFRSVR
jgi:hypothetical protein